MNFNFPLNCKISFTFDSLHHSSQEPENTRFQNVDTFKSIWVLLLGDQTNLKEIYKLKT